MRQSSSPDASAILVVIVFCVFWRSPFPPGTSAQNRRFGQATSWEKKLLARKYSKSASKDVESAVRRKKKGTLKSGPGGKGGKVKSRRQAIAIGLSEARKKGKKVPKNGTARKTEKG